MKQLFTMRLREFLKSADLLCVRVDDVASHFAMSPTTFRRRLLFDGTGWGEELELARKLRFEDMWLSRPGAGAAFYFGGCGFSNINSFYRCFTRWYGLTFRSFCVQQRVAA